jgi:AcrR family transcriptional regulator
MKARKAAKRRAFVDVATRLFGEDGYHATTVPRIVEASGSSTGSFYSYFDNKEAVFTAALRDVGDRLAAALNRAIEGSEQPVDQMRAAVRETFRFLAEHPLDARILVIESSGLSTELEAVRREIHDTHARSVEATLRDLLEDEDGTDSAILARCWIGAVYEAVRAWLELEPDERIPAERAAEVVAHFNLRGAGLV